MNPADAFARGIAAGDTVGVRSRVGAAPIAAADVCTRIDACIARNCAIAVFGITRVPIVRPVTKLSS